LITVLLTVIFYAANSYLTARPMTPLKTRTAATAVAPPGYYIVTQDIDGDTFQIVMDGKKESIRLIGVDTPETHKPNTPVQCYGPEASDFARQTVEGKAVRLEADPTNDNRDRYDRLLRYAYLQDGTLFNKQIVEQGYGFAYLSFPFQKKQEFADAQAQAVISKRGLWAACQPFQESSGRWQTNPYDAP
jgi:endonuclease YncB( thermonuclease family)